MAALAARLPTGLPAPLGSSYDIAPALRDPAAIPAPNQLAGQAPHAGSPLLDLVGYSQVRYYSVSPKTSVSSMKRPRDPEAAAEEDNKIKKMMEEFEYDTMTYKEWSQIALALGRTAAWPKCSQT